MARVAPTIKAVLVLFTYYNPIYQRGFEAFVKEIADAGAKGLLVPDIPLEETDELSKICAKNGLDLVLLSTPTTPSEPHGEDRDGEQRVHLPRQRHGGDGRAHRRGERVEELVAKLKTVTDKPVCVGFGISKEEQAQQVVRWGADGVIVGSALVKALGEAASPKRASRASTRSPRSCRGVQPRRRQGARHGGILREPVREEVRKKRHTVTSRRRDASSEERARSTVEERVSTRARLVAASRVRDRAVRKTFRVSSRVSARLRRF